VTSTSSGESCRVRPNAALVGASAFLCVDSSLCHKWSVGEISVDEPHDIPSGLIE